MSTHEGNPTTDEILAGDAVWAEAPDVLDAVLDQIRAPAARTRWRWVAVSAAAAIAVVTGVVVTRPDPVDFTLAGTDLAPTAAADVDVVETPVGIIYRLRVDGLDPAPSGSYYQGWVATDDETAWVSVGTFHMRGGDGMVAFWSGVDPGRYPVLVVTLQDEDGGPARSDTVVMTGRA